MVYKSEVVIYFFIENNKKNIYENIYLLFHKHEIYSHNKT